MRLRGWMSVGLVVASSCVDAGSPDDAGDRDGPACARTADCDDGVFCNGEERCDPVSADADPRGCTPGAPPCGTRVCSEEGIGCAGCEPADGDGDGADAVACGGGDCDDADPGRFPLALEVCDVAGHDEDCNPLTFGARDLDGDGEISIECCNDDRCGADCDDMRASVGTFGTERCDGIDGDCDGRIDEGLALTLFADVDGDGYGADPIEACAPGAPHTSARGGDCNDARASVHPGATEACNGLDDDCNGRVDGNESCAFVAAEGARCIDGACVFDRCMPGRADCNGNMADGCEADLGATSTCGRCDQTCAESHGTASCIDGRCDVVACDTGFHRCDGRCERISTASCGETCAPCGTVPGGYGASCTGGRCLWYCDLRYEMSELADGSTTCLWDDPALDGLELDVTPLFLNGTEGWARVRGDASAVRVTIRQSPMAVQIVTLGASVLTPDVPSAPIPLELGENHVTLQVVTESGRMLDYHLLVVRIDQEVHYLKPSSPSPELRFGDALDLDGDRLAVGGWGRYEGPTGSSVHLFVRVGEDWILEDRIESEGARALALSGDRLVLGLPNAPGGGLVQVYRRVGTSWALERSLRPPTPEDSDQFGTSVDIDEGVVVVGAPGESSSARNIDGDDASTAAPESGAVYVFSGPTLDDATYVKAPNTRPGMAFGTTLALDGDRLVVGAAHEASGATGIDGDPFGLGATSGAVFLLERTGGTWAHHTYFKPTFHSSSHASFGSTLALDGDLLAIGHLHGTDLYEHAGSTWSRELEIPVRGAVDIEGVWLVVGAVDDASPATELGPNTVTATTYGFYNAGAAYLYRRADTGWRRWLYIKVPNTAEGDALGHSVAVGIDVAWIGAPFEDGDALGYDGPFGEGVIDSGAAYLVRHP